VQVQNPPDILREQLVAVGADSTGAALGADKEKVLKELKKRKLVVQKITKTLTVVKGPEFTENPAKAEAGTSPFSSLAATTRIAVT